MTIKSITTLISFITSRRAALALLMLSSGSVLITGCSDTSPVQSSATGLRMPGVGSIFAYRTHLTIGDEVSVLLDTVEVLRTGLTLGGRSNVVEMQTYGPYRHHPYTYMSADADGNVSYAECYTEYITPDHVPTTIFWVTYPLAGKGTTTAGSPETVIVNGSAEPELTCKVRYIGNETVDGGTLPIASAKFDVSKSYANSSGDPTISTRQYWISTSTGMKSKFLDVTEGSPGIVTESVLVSQTIK